MAGSTGDDGNVIHGEGALRHALLVKLLLIDGQLVADPVVQPHTQDELQREKRWTNPIEPALTSVIGVNQESQQCLQYVLQCRITEEQTCNSNTNQLTFESWHSKDNKTKIMRR